MGSDAIIKASQKLIH